jgi:hypothetical protein
MNYLRIVATDAFSASRTRLMNLTAQTSSSDSAPAHTILSDTVFVKAHDSIELYIPLRSENELRMAPENLESSSAWDKNDRPI